MASLRHLPSIAHELPRRLRVRAPHLFQRRDLDVAALAGQVESLPGVVAARVNAGARSLVIDYDGRGMVRHAVLYRITASKSGVVRVVPS